MSTGNSTQNIVWPLPKFYFQVSVDGTTQSSFQEVSGLETEPATVEYRPGHGQPAAPTKLSGLAKAGHVTLKRGVVAHGSALATWLSQIKANASARRTVVIQLLNESGQPTMTWTLANASPAKVSAPSLGSEANEVAVESLDLAFETMVISAP